MGYLYRLVFQNGKSYIGVSSNTPMRRFYQHRNASKRYDNMLYKAWRKYGEPVLEVLAVVSDCDLYETEKRAIAMYGTFGTKGYNSTPGGEESPALSPIVRAKISAGLTGRTVSSNTRMNMSIGAKVRFSRQLERDKQAARMTGKVDSEETKVKKSQAGLKRFEDPVAREAQSAIATKLWSNDTFRLTMERSRIRGGAKRSFKGATKAFMYFTSNNVSARDALTVRITSVKDN